MARRWLTRALFLGAAFASPPVAASVHFWDINEVYSSPDGGVQFIELFTQFNFQTNFSQLGAGVRLLAVSGPTPGEFPTTFTLLSTTANHHLLVAFVSQTLLAPGQSAAQKFMELGGPEPDLAFDLRVPFFDPAGDKLCFRIQKVALDCLNSVGSETPDSFTLYDVIDFTTVPGDFDGTASLDRSGTVGFIGQAGPLVLDLELGNSPTNFAVQGGTVVVPEPVALLERLAALGVVGALHRLRVRRRRARSSGGSRHDLGAPHRGPA